MHNTRSRTVIILLVAALIRNTYTIGKNKENITLNITYYFVKYIIHILYISEISIFLSVLSLNMAAKYKIRKYKSFYQMIQVSKNSHHSESARLGVFFENPIMKI